ncbi:MAG: hypothetical protein FWC47_06925 [Oscillospiraceae bacterium]|nr:hypothetical protein [Oscillospiraceae bacterium]
MELSCILTGICRRQETSKSKAVLEYDLDDEIILEPLKPIAIIMDDELIKRRDNEIIRKKYNIKETKTATIL